MLDGRTCRQNVVHCQSLISEEVAPPVAGKKKKNYTSHERQQHESSEKSTKALTDDLLLQRFLFALRPDFLSLGIQVKSISEALAQESSGQVHSLLR